jgi:phosphoribosylformylglycinamidine synthase
MNYTAHIDIMPLKELLDPQGKAVRQNLKNLDIHAVSDVRIGKHIELKIEAETEEDAKVIAEKVCKGILANMIMESYEISISS